MKPDSLALLDLFLKGTSVLLLAFAITALLRRCSAANRSLAWLAAFVVMTLLPLGCLVEPAWKLPVVVVTQKVPVPMLAPKVDPFAPTLPDGEPSSLERPSSDAWSMSWTVKEVAVTFYVTGALLVLAFRLVGAWQLRSVRRNGFAGDARLQELVTQVAASRGMRRRIETLISDQVAVPMTWGTLRHVLVLPAQAANWSDDELRAALQHEVAHMAHHDAARRWLGTIVSALWWPHPLVWLAAKAWRLEQERSCDDAVIRGGADARCYAAQLLDVARMARLGRLQSAAALVMAMPSGLETRLRSLVDVAASRSEARAGARIIAVIAASAVLGASLTLGAGAAIDGDGRMILVRSKFIEIKEDSAALQDEVVKQWQSGKSMTLNAAAMETLLRRLAQRKGVDILSAPSVTTKPGQKATVEVAREFIYPTEFTKDPAGVANSPIPPMTPTTFEVMPLGVLLDVTAQWAGKSINLQPTATVNEFRGFAKAGPANMERDKKDVWRVKDPDALALAKPPASAASAEWNAAAKDRYETAKDGIKLKPDEVLVPQFTTQKWEGKASLKSDEWIVAGLDVTSGKREPGRGRVWVLISASAAEVAASAASPASANSGVETLLQKARGIVLPTVEFRNASVMEAIEFLKVKSRELDAAKQGVNIIVRNDPPSTAQITLSLRDVPLNEALRYVTELAGMELRWEAFAAVVRPIGEPEGMEMFARMYSTAPGIMGKETDAKKWLSSQSVVFAEGSAASFDEKTAKLMVKNVPRELRKVDAILQKLGIMTDPDPPKPEIEQRADKIIFPVVQFRDATLAEAVEFLRLRSRDFDPDKKGMNIVLIGEAAKSPAKITLDLRNVPLSEALKYVTALAGVRLIPQANAFVIAPLTTEAGR